MPPGGGSYYDMHIYFGIFDNATPGIVTNCMTAHDDIGPIDIQGVDNCVDITNCNEKVYKPIDKKSNYVKRCVGIPGDSLEVRGGYVYIDGEKNDLPDRARLQFVYKIKSKSVLVKISPENRLMNKPNDYFAERYQVSDMYAESFDKDTKDYYYKAHLTDEAYLAIKNNPDVISIEKVVSEKKIKGSGLSQKALNMIGILTILVQF